jgi:alkanesulfonate monooxygenase SsuD/methylene tetrahydromethanopterin reductase-like flavin-dependent oxidoreductase (luciferase family)
MENHGQQFHRRWKLLRERIEAMKAIWTEEEASYAGEFVNFEKIISYPKPKQTPYPPVLMGGATEMSLKRVARYCDGWMPIDALLENPAAMVTKMRKIVAEQGRDPEGINLSAFCQKNRTADSIQNFREAGFTRAIIALPNRDQSTVLRFIDEYIGLGEKIG